MSLTFDGTWDAPRVNGAPRLQYDVPELPLEPTSIAVPMMCKSSDYAALTSGASTSFNGDTWYALGDSGFSDVGGGVWSFTREWIKKPTTTTAYNYETYASVHPGLVYNRVIRDPILINQNSKIAIEFFLIQAASGDYTEAGSIPITNEDRAEFPGGGTAPLLSNIYLKNYSFFLTTPSASAYQDLIDTDTSTLTSYSVQAEPSAIYQVRGPLWRRETRTLKAK